MKWLIVPLLVVFSSCALFGPRFYRTSFEYEQNGAVHSFPALVPPGFVKKETSADSLGNQGVLYQYATGSFFILYAADTNVVTLPQIDPEENQPLPHSSGGWVYKGMHEDGTFWRLVRHPHVRVGYTSVPQSMEVIFDSAVNYTANRVQ